MYTEEHLKIAFLAGTEYGMDCKTGPMTYHHERTKPTFEEWIAQFK